MDSPAGFRVQVLLIGLSTVHATEKLLFVEQSYQHKNYAAVPSRLHSLSRCTKAFTGPLNYPSSLGLRSKCNDWA